MGADARQAMLAKQTLVNEGLRSEVDNLYIYFCRVPPLLDVSVSALIRKVLI